MRGGADSGDGPIPDKGWLALTLVHRAQASGVRLTAVFADAEYGDNNTLRATLHRQRLPYALGISPTLTMCPGTPTLRIDRRHAPPRATVVRGGPIGTP